MENLTLHCEVQAYNNGCTKGTATLPASEGFDNVSLLGSLTHNMQLPNGVYNITKQQSSRWVALSKCGNAHIKLVSSKTRIRVKWPALLLHNE